MTTMPIKHNTSTPLWPQGNFEVDAVMKLLGKAILTAHLEGRPLRQELAKFLNDGEQKKRGKIYADLRH